MGVLLLRFAGPMQSWGSESKFEVRRTDLYPTRSGVIGMIASALGRRREESIEDLKDLKIGFRVDQPGTVIEDFHTAKGKKDYVTQRYYLCDAVFVVGVASENEELLQKTEEALKNPVFPLFLGRRSCPPVLPVVLNRSELSLEQALKKAAYTGNRNKNGKVKLVLPSDSIRKGILRKDSPGSFSQIHREYAYQPVIETYTQLSDVNGEAEEDFDAFGYLEEALC